MPRTGLVVVLVAAAGVLGTVYIGYRGSENVAFLTAPVERGSLESAVKATGTVTAVLTVDVSSQLSGRIAEVLVDFNDEVRAGQILARIDPEIYVARVSEAEAALKIARATVEVQRATLRRAAGAIENARTARAVAAAQVAALQARFEQTERDFQRKTLLARSSNISEVDLSRARTQRDAEASDLRAAVEQIAIKAQEIEIAQAERDIAQANLRSAEAVVEQRQAALEQAKVDLERTQIRSPIDGVIIKREVNPGQTLAVSFQATTLFKIANDLRLMQVEGRIDEADVGRLKPGQRAKFTVDAFPDKMFSGQVLQVRKAPEVAQNVVSYTAIVSASNPDALLYPGMTANLKITVSESPDLLMVPNQALRFHPREAPAHITGPEKAVPGGGRSGTVWVLDRDGRPLPVSVALGQSDERATQLVSGALEEGQPVVVGTAPAAARSSVGLRLGM